MTHFTLHWTEKGGKTETVEVKQRPLCGCCGAVTAHKFKLEEPKKVFAPGPFVLRLNPESNEGESTSLRLTITVTVYDHYMVDMPKLTLR